MGKKWEIQSQNQYDTVKVSTEYDRKSIDTNPRTDFLLIERASGEKQHISVDQNGNMTKWHDYRQCLKPQYAGAIFFFYKIGYIFIMEYTFEKRFEYAKWLFSQDISREEMCDILSSKLALDDKMDDILSKGLDPDAEIFDLTIRYLDRGYAYEKEQNFQKLLDILDLSNPKK